MKAFILSAVYVVVAGLPAAARAETVTYSYDARGRLAGTSIAGGPGAGIATTIGYDDAGNRTSHVVFAAPPPAIVNASFEEPNVGAGFQYNPSVAGNYFGSLAGVAGNGSAWGFTAPATGNQVAFIQGSGSNNGSVVMNVSGLVIGATYVVRFFAARRLSYTPNMLHVTFQNNNLGYLSPSSTNFQQLQTVSFQAASTVGALNFTGETGGDSATGIDAIEIVRTP